MPKPLIETLCSPADISILRRRDVRSFLRDLQSWAVTEEDRRRVEQLFTLVDDSLGFAVFEAIESAKKELSQADRATVSFSYPTIEISEEIEQGDFASMSERTTERIVASLDEALHNAKKRPEEIELVCLTGGTARVPPLAAALRERFPSERMHALRSFHSVIQGLAERAHAWLLTGNSTALNDSASLRM